MSRYVKSLIEKELANRFANVEALGVISPHGIDATRNNLIRRRLRQKGLRVTVVKNALARRALAGKLKAIERLLDGPSAFVYGNVSVSAIARALLEEKKAEEKLQLRGIYFDGEVYPGEDGVKTVSALPTREEAIGNIVAALLGPGRRLAGALLGPGRRLAGAIKAIEEKASSKEQPAGESATSAPSA